MRHGRMLESRKSRPSHSRIALVPDSPGAMMRLCTARPRARCPRQVQREQRWSGCRAFGPRPAANREAHGGMPSKGASGLVSRKRVRPSMLAPAARGALSVIPIEASVPSQYVLHICVGAYGDFGDLKEGSDLHDFAPASVEPATTSRRQDSSREIRLLGTLALLHDCRAGAPSPTGRSAFESGRHADHFPFFPSQACQR